jgi:hypothetical protein
MAYKCYMPLKVFSKKITLRPNGNHKHIFIQLSYIMQNL